MVVFYQQYQQLFNRLRPERGKVMETYKTDKEALEFRKSMHVDHYTMPIVTGKQIGRAHV